MSHNSDEALLIPRSDSFWEPGNYKRTTKRIEDGHNLCLELISLLQDRAEIEKSYAKSLKSWSRKWNDKIEKGPEYGTMEASWKGLLAEADRLCEVHMRVQDNLCIDVCSKIKDWQKDNYHKSMMQLKEKKDMDDQFKKAQKPWAKLLAKVNKAKSDYHTACKNEKSAINQERNASGDSSLSVDQMKKLQERVSKAKEDVQKTKERYEIALKEINENNPMYMENMTVVFNKCQDMESERLRFFKEMLFSVQKGLNISVDPELPQIYEELHHTISNADDEKDLRWWSNNHGVNMAMQWPQFEDPAEEFRDIARKTTKGGHIPSGNITLLNQRSVGEEFPEQPKSKSTKNQSKQASRGMREPDRVNDERMDNKRNSAMSSNGKENNPFEEEEWDEDPSDALVDHGEPGVAVRALYDYDGMESDELSFKAGEEFEKLEDEDEQGWCKGRKDGRVGLYPANYVEMVR